MFLDDVVTINVNAPTGIVVRNNLFQYCWVVEKESAVAKKYIQFGVADSTIYNKDGYVLLNKTTGALVDGQVLADQAVGDNILFFIKDIQVNNLILDVVIPSTIDLAIKDGETLTVGNFANIGNNIVNSDVVQDDDNPLTAEVIAINGNNATLNITYNNTIEVTDIGFGTVIDDPFGVSLNTPTLVKGSDFVNYFNNEKMIALGNSLGSEKLYLVNNKALSKASDVCFWLVDSLGVLTPTELALFKGFKILTEGSVTPTAITKANTQYTGCIVDGNTATSPYELEEAYLNRTVANLNDMQYMSLLTWEPVVESGEAGKEAFNSNLIFANIPDLSTPAVELANLKMGGISWTRLLIGEYIKQQLQNTIKSFIKNNNPNMEQEDYAIVAKKGNDLLQIYINQGVIGEGALFEVDYNQSTADIIQGNLRNIKVTLDGVNSMWRAEATLFS